MLLSTRRPEVVGVAPAPPGVTPNFANPPSIRHIPVIVNTVFTIISLVFVTLRLYTVCSITRNVRTEDCGFSLILTLKTSLTSVRFYRFFMG